MFLDQLILKTVSLFRLVYRHINLNLLVNLSDIVACEYRFTAAEGYVKTPGYPNSYPNGLNCSWLITVPQGSRIKLSSEVFDLESTYNCERDALYIYDGKDERAALYSKPFCDVYGPTKVYSTRNAMFLRFVTDDRDNSKGFLLKYESFKSKCLLPVCFPT